MVNYADNTFAFYGPTEHINKIAGAVVTRTLGHYERTLYYQELDFAAIRPIPQELLDIDAQVCRDGVPLSVDETLRLVSVYGACTPGTWASINWGTPSGEKPEIKMAPSPAGDDDPGSSVLVLRFATAWSAPTTLLRYLHDLGIQILGGTIIEDSQELEIISYLNKIDPGSLQEERLFHSVFTIESVEEEDPDAEEEYEEPLISRRIELATADPRVVRAAMQH